MFLLFLFVLGVVHSLPTKTQFLGHPVAVERSVREDGEAHRFYRREFWVDFCFLDGIPAPERAAEYAARWGVTNLGPIYEGACKYLFAQDWGASSRMQSRGAATLGNELIPLVRMKRYVPRGTGRAPFRPARPTTSRTRGSARSGTTEARAASSTQPPISTARAHGGWA